jgi:anti-sigma factor RsiW
MSRPRKYIMGPPHGDRHDDAWAYVLGSLDPDERSAFEAHLSECDECAAEVRSFRKVAAALAYSVPRRTLTAELRRGVLEALAGRDESIGCGWSPDRDP